VADAACSGAGEGVEDGAGMMVKMAVGAANAEVAGLNPLITAATTAHKPIASSNPNKTINRLNLLFTG
jgi:hypothetical protein